MNAVAVEVLGNPLQGVAGARFLGIGGVLHARESCHTPALFSVKSAYMQLAVFQLLAGGGGKGIRTPGLLIAKEKYGITTGLDEEGRTATKRDETLFWTGFRHGLKATSCDKLRRGQKPRAYTPGIYTIYTPFRLWRVMGLKDYVSVPLNFKRSHRAFRDSEIMKSRSRSFESQGASTQEIDAARALISWVDRACGHSAEDFTQPLIKAAVEVTRSFQGREIEEAMNYLIKGRDNPAVVKRTDFVLTHIRGT